MTPKIELMPEKMLVGLHLSMSLTNNRTGELWKSFMSRRKEILHHTSNELISMQVYSPSHFIHFDPTREFEKWAAVEVSHFEHIPDRMETFVIAEGLYAVFAYIGSSADNSIFNYIFSTWLPNSAYDLDHRPHFEVLGVKYKNNDITSEEEIWIPIKPKKI